jgi:tetratricopeptide (TPR) repeat protein
MRKIRHIDGRQFNKYASTRVFANTVGTRQVPAADRQGMQGAHRCRVGRKIDFYSISWNHLLKNILAIVTLSATLSACAGGSLQPATKENNANAITVAAAEQPATGYGAVRELNVKAATSQAEDTLPSVQLTEELIFKYLSAEIADQRGNWQAAYVTMLAIAQQTRDPRIARRAAEIALKSNQPSEALAAIRLWRDVAPHSEEAAQYYMSFILLSDNLEEAQPLLQQRLQETPPQTRGPMILQIQRLLARAKNKAAAFSLLENLVAPYKSLPEARLALAQAAFVQGDNARASEEAQAALAANPSSELAALTMAQVLADKNEAVKSLAGFLKQNPQAREVRLAYARLLVEQKQYEQAQTEFKILLKEQPNDLTALYALGLLATQSKNPNEAEKYLTTYLAALEANPDEDRDPTQALLILSQLAEERNDMKAAHKWLDQIDPATRQAYFNAQLKRAQLFARDGDIPAARSLLKGLDTQGEEEQVQVMMVETQILRSADQTQEALKVMEAGLKRFPDNTDLLYDHAMLAEKLDKLDLMEASLRKVIKLAPKNQHAYNALGYSLAERNLRLKEAYELIDKALALAPEDPFIMDSMGWVQFRLGKLDEAERLLRRAYELRPDPEIAAHLGEVLWVKGQREDAKKFWRDARSKDPKNDTLKNTLMRFQVSL